MALKRLNKLIALIFFGNYFYGICAVALSIESSLQQRFLAPDPLFLILAFASTLLFYSKAYIKTEVSEDVTNLRSFWYQKNKKMMQKSQLFFLILLLVVSLYFILAHYRIFLNLQKQEWSLIFLFPFVAALYYGFEGEAMAKKNLRNIGLLKPFIIGFTWAGLVTIYPIMFLNIKQGIHYHIDLLGTLLFIKNFVFISILSILFDIKDYAMDYNHELKTLIVKLGPRKAIYYIIFPLLILSLGSFLLFADSQHFSSIKIFIHSIPFAATIIVVFTMFYRRSILYYLIVVDGLMLLKALCGISAIIYF